MEKIVVRVVNRSSNPLPQYQTVDSVGMDLTADIPEPIVLGSLQRALVPTGLSVAIPAGYEIQVRPRSGLAAKHGVTVLNTPGTIDPDYRGEVKVILVNLSADSYTIEPGERIAQAVLARYEQLSWEPTEELDTTTRGGGGFGSTGK